MVLLFCKDAVGVQPHPAGPKDTRWGRGILSSAEMQSVYFTAGAYWAKGHSFVGGEGVLPICRDAVGVFYSRT